MQSRMDIEDRTDCRCGCGREVEREFPGVQGSCKITCTVTDWTGERERVTFGPFTSFVCAKNWFNNLTRG